MLHHLLEIVIWLLLAFIVGALFGCLLRNLFGGRAERGAEARVTGATLAEGYAGKGAGQAQGAAAGTGGAAAAAAVTASAAAGAGGVAAREAAGSLGAQALMGEKAVAEAEEKDARKKAEEEAAAKKAEEEEARRRAEEEKREKAEEEAARKKAEEEAAAKKAEEAPAATGDDVKWKVPLLGLREPTAGEPDNLEMISGIGPKLAKMLHDMGIYYFAQIARWDEKIIEEVDKKLKFKGRIQRDEWVRQAKLLAEGKLEQFEREYGTGGLKDESGKTRSGTRTRKSAGSKGSKGRKK